MICTLTARRLKPGSYDDFRKAWGDERPRRNGAMEPRLPLRDVEDENVVVSFGFFEGDLEDLRETQERMGRENQVSSIEPYVEETLLDASYEVIEELAS